MALIYLSIYLSAALGFELWASCLLGRHLPLEPSLQPFLL
jgi:hypothetical protein